MPIQDIQPYQEGDFSGKGNRVYNGPIYNVRYPSELDDVQESSDWFKLGYNVMVGHGNSDGTFTLRVMGDIPEWVQERFREVGVGVELYKAMG